MKVVTLFIVYIAVVAILQGFVLKVLWGWFLVKSLHAPNISVAAAIGISLVVGMLTIPYQRRSEEEYIEMMIHEAYNPILILVIGFIVHLFM
jgi:hypothetical protein